MIMIFMILSTCATGDTATIEDDIVFSPCGVFVLGLHGYKWNIGL